MFKTVAVLLFSLVTGVSTASAAGSSDTRIPGVVRLANTDTELLLNGSGIRKKFFMDIYIGALYLPATTGDVQAILSDTGPASVRMHFLYQEVGKQKIVDGWHDGLSDNLSAADYAALQPQLEQFNSLFRTVHRDDVISIDYSPDTGTEVRINNERRGSVAGNEFFRALLRVWLGSRPVSKALKQDMLGLD